jgi:hypothetical protein
VRSALSLCVTYDGEVGTARRPRAAATRLVADFESHRGYEQAGGYGGLATTAQRLGDLTRYYLGQKNGQWSMPGSAWLLGCNCGDRLLAAASVNHR